ncbi:DUF4437 domain-containing protein [Roseiterribacter gracilis]|uniref:DUF4437 domain-containing protein n=1 Tax=Roseiterribacter gracilis TaxID=2812848 RepID=A0A8S8X948_9PROT|nr:hypothetical protein TMPK1_03060 [Rhodospirillales bacterium TMPK1]
MTRPWIEFVQSQKIAWKDDDGWAAAPGASVRILSRDSDTNAASLMLRLPKGWTAPAGALNVDEEFLVLEGAVEIGGTRYGKLGFAHFPAGYDAGARSAPEGAIILSFFDGKPVRSAARAYNEARLVKIEDAMHVPYTGNFHPEFPPGAGRKLLYVDPTTNDTTWILGTLPLRWAERAEIHPTVEEMYLLSGEVHGNRGVMRPGAYFWRPANVPHGPYGSLTGNLYFFRTKGGSLKTEYVEPERKFMWWPPYDAQLPQELEHARGETEPAPSWW